MDIKDYLHLYLGCPIRYRDARRGFVFTELSPHALEFPTAWPELALALRPLSDMTEEECEFFYHWYFDKRYAEDWSGDTGSAYFKPKKVKPTFEHVKRVLDGQDYASDGFRRTIELTKWMLDLHFDIFNLIPAGLALDATKMLNSDKNPERGVATEDASSNVLDQQKNLDHE